MKRLFYSLLLLSQMSVCHAATVTLPRAEQFELRAATTDNQPGPRYRILVALPDGPAPAGGYPVVYVLDADLVFHSVVETLRLQSRRPLATGVLPALVVGISYPEEDDVILRRAVDYTPTPAAQPAADMSATMRSAGGGADRFLDFIDKTLRPTIAQRYATNPNHQVLFGHSLGGLFALHALFNRPQSFTHYIAASPSWWWNDKVMATEESAFRRQPDAARGRALLLTVGEFEQSPSRFSDNMPGGIATLTRRAMVDNVRALSGRLITMPGMRVKALELTGENHLSSLPQAINRGLRFALEP
ncbi:alpha/beta hydrolase [Viridibacterium curvum]|uniref:Ferri-bacillibactin esterase BesA n=1 Tax=Viridibacterium curvum TaxID=1101404 RepID=A0ABP9QFF0_9RHOO